MAKIKIILTEKKEQEIDVEFPIYRKNKSLDITVYTKVLSEKLAIDILVYDSKEDCERFQFEIYKPHFFVKDMDYLMGEKQYQCTEEIFLQQLAHVKDMLSIEKIVS